MIEKPGISIQTTPNPPTKIVPTKIARVQLGRNNLAPPSSFKIATSNQTPRGRNLKPCVWRVG
eukprot:7154194-Heterocapsa_arctica.AAC.1